MIIHKQRKECSEWSFILRWSSCEDLWYRVRGIKTESFQRINFIDAVSSARLHIGSNARVISGWLYIQKLARNSEMRFYDSESSFWDVVCCGHLEIFDPQEVVVPVFFHSAKQRSFKIRLNTVILFFILCPPSCENCIKFIIKLLNVLVAEGVLTSINPVFAIPDRAGDKRFEFWWPCVACVIWIPLAITL